jgi:uncharacterized membrane protein (DUF485 family)
LPEEFPPEPEPVPIVSASPALAGTLMRRQASLSLRVAFIFLLLILGLPLLTHFAPEAMQRPMLGFPISWFVLGIAFYPITWALSAYFVRASERLEEQDAEMIRRERFEA